MMVVKIITNRGWRDDSERKSYYNSVEILSVSVVRNLNSLSIETLYPFHPPISRIQKRKEDSPEGPE